MLNQLLDYAGGPKFDIDFSAMIDFCEMAKAKFMLDESSCVKKYGDLNDPTLKNEVSEPLQKMICYYSTNFKYIYDDEFECSDFNHGSVKELIEHFENEKMCSEDDDSSKVEPVSNKASDTDEVEDEDEDDETWQVIRRIACFALKPLRELENDDTLATCDNSPDQTVTALTVGYDLNKIDMDMEAGPWVLPLFNSMKNLVTMDFDSFAKAGENFMERFGLYDMNALTGLDIANDLRDLAMAMPNGLEVTKFEFEAELKDEYLYCTDEDGKVDKSKPLIECHDYFVFDWGKPYIQFYAIFVASSLCLLSLSMD
jgi:hypothetical protein